MSSLSDLKVLLGLDPDAVSDKQDTLLSLILQNTDMQMRFKLGLKAEEELPAELGYIPLEVAVRRFNRLKNEGMTSYSQEGESITFSSNDFDDYEADLAEWRKRNKLDVLTTVNPYKPKRR